MSHELNLAVAIPEQALIFTAPAVLLIVVVLAVVLVRKRRTSHGKRSPWATASQELGIELVKGGSGTIARGKVNDHVVCIAPTASKGRRKRKSTLYNVKYEGPEAPKFTLVKRVNDDIPVLDTGNPKFDAVVAVRTSQPEQFASFVTPPRRAAILRLLTYWPVAQITDREAHLKTPGIEDDHDKLVDSICHLVATAESFDRPTPAPAKAPKPTAVAAVPEPGRFVDVPSAAGPTDDLVAAGQANFGSGVETPSPTHELGEPSERDVLTDVRLDEISVLGDLFNSGLTPAGIAARFAQVYQGCEVTWSGEILRVGSTDGNRQRIAAFIGSADGQRPDSGRVVALTTVDASLVVAEGDVVGFVGTLANLDAAQRLFHLA